MRANKFASLIGVGAGALGAMLLVALVVNEGFGWKVECSTTWNGVGWNSCASDAVEAPSSAEATLIVTAPECYNADERWGKAAHSTTQVARADCAGSNECCKTAYWTTTQGVLYACFAYNTSSTQDCGPTTARIQNGHIVCTWDGPEQE